MNFIRRLYLDACCKIYSVGKAEFEKRESQKMALRAIVKAGSIFYPGSEVINFSEANDRIKIGSNCHIYGTLVVMPFGGNITFGDNCSFGDLSRIVSATGVRIGNRVMIAHNVNILDNNSHPLDSTLRHQDFMEVYSHQVKEYDLKSKEVVIEDDVWIGFNSIIMKGVKIGRGAIIGAGSVVTKDVPEFVVMAGNPIREISKSS